MKIRRDSSMTNGYKAWNSWNSFPDNRHHHSFQNRTMSFALTSARPNRTPSGETVSRVTERANKTNLRRVRVKERPSYKGSKKSTHTWSPRLFLGADGKSVLRPSFSRRPCLSRNNVLYARRTWAFLHATARCVGGGSEEEKESMSCEASDHMAVPPMRLPPGLACQCFVKCCAVLAHNPWPSTTLTKCPLYLHDGQRAMTWKLPGEARDVFARHELPHFAAAPNFVLQSREHEEEHTEAAMICQVFAWWPPEVQTQIGNDQVIVNARLRRHRNWLC